MKDPKMIFKLDLPPLLLIHQFPGLKKNRKKFARDVSFLVRHVCRTEVPPLNVAYLYNFLFDVSEKNYGFRVIVSITTL